MLLLPAEMGKRLGFEVGDLVLISEPPSPATSPAPTSRPARLP
jgi:hypothetical protein